MGFKLPMDELVKQILLAAERCTPHLKLTKTGVSLVPQDVLWAKWRACCSHDGRKYAFLTWLDQEIPHLREAKKQARRRKSCT